MARYIVMLTHNEEIEVEANSESDALHKAYSMAEANCFWDEINIEEVEEEEENENE